jgi:endonuclease G
MKLLKSLFTITLLLLIVSCGKDESDSQPSGIKKNDNKNSTSIYPEASRLEMPKLKGGQSILLVHKTNDKYDPDGINYCVEWDKEKKSQRWSCYQMTQNSNKQNANRYYGNPQYPFDPELPSGAYFDTDLFYGSGFDHGHICPSNDRRFSEQTNYQTFYLTNMQPQYSVFNGSADGLQNQSLWLQMENFIHGLVGKLRTTDTLYVCRGGTIDNDNILMRIKDQLIVPKYFFSAALLKNSLGYKAIAFWFDHSNTPVENLKLSPYVKNIRELETLTGIDFFCNLDDETEEHVETLDPKNIITSWGVK